MQTPSLTAVVVMYVAALIMLVLEAFLPGAVMGLIGACLLVVSVYFGFATQGTGMGVAMVVIACAVVPTAFQMGFRRLALKKTLAEAEGFRVGSDALDSLVGAVGLTVTPLRPAGTALFGTRRVDVVTSGEHVEKDTPVRVLDVEGARVVVRIISDAAAEAPDRPAAGT